MKQQKVRLSKIDVKWLLSVWVVMGGLSISESSLAVWTSGTNTVVTSITQTGAHFEASITTNSTGSGNYDLNFFVTAPYQGFVGGASPATVSVNGNSTTSFASTTTALYCGTSYTVSGVYLPDNWTVGNAYTSFITLPCTPQTVSVQNSPQTFNGSPISAVVACSSGVSASNIKYNGNSTAPTAAGTYAVTASCVGTANYSPLTDAAAGDLVITSGAPTLMVTNSPQFYTGSAVAATVTCSSGGVVSDVKYNGSSTAPTAAGTYAVTASCAASGGFLPLTDAAAGDLVISSNAPTVVVTNSPQSYTGTPIAATVTCSSGGVVSDVKYNGSSTAPTAAGTYAVTASCATNGGFPPLTDAAAGDLVITTVAPTIGVTNSPQIYSGSPIAATVTCSSGVVVSDVKYNGNSSEPTAAGTYAVTASCAATANYSALTNASAGNLVITPAAPTVMVTNSPQSYTGSTIAATVACSSGGAVSNIKYNAFSTVPTAAGTYAVTASCAATANYSALTNAAAGNLVINKAVPTVVVTNSPQTFRDQPISAWVTCSSGVYATNIKYNGNSTAPTAAGTYAVTASCTATANYSALTNAAAGDLVITPREPFVEVTNSPRFYSGSAIPATVTCSSGGAVSDVKYNGSSTVPTDAGTYAVTANCAATGNYSALTDAAAGDLVIRTIPPLVVVTNSPQIYTGSAIAANVTCSSGGAVSDVKYNGNSIVPTEAGTYTVTANCAATGNYSALTGSIAGNFSINPAGFFPGGTVTASITGGAFVPGTAYFTAPINPPAGQIFPYGMFGFTATPSSVGQPIVITLTYPQSLAGKTVWKALNGVWLNWTSVVSLSGNTLTYSITDGGTGDADGVVNGSITDPIGISIPSPIPPPPANPIPTLYEWAQIIMIFLMTLTAGVYGRRIR